MTANYLYSALNGIALMFGEQAKINGRKEKLVVICFVPFSKPFTPEKARQTKRQRFICRLNRVAEETAQKNV